MKHYVIAASFLFVVFFMFVQCSNKHKTITSNSKPISHEVWDGLLKKLVSPEGKVNYKGFIEEKETFSSYLNLLSNNHPNDNNWSEQEKLAYWINAYNAYTVKLVVDHYPVKSIKDIGGFIPFVNSVWNIQFIKIEGHEYDLNNIEHSILRTDFKEPRIHFAINCASFSCPKLLNEAYVVNKLDAQLNEAAIHFINNPDKNKLSPEKIEISKIFSWFQGDFTSTLGKGGILAFINKYSKIKINRDAEVAHMDYNWSLNE